MLEIRGLTVDYGNGPVLQSLDLTCERGKVHGLVGRNGEGKTTLLNAIYGSVRPNAGRIEWDGTPLLHQQIGYLQTELYFYPMITAGEYLEVFQSRNPQFDLEGWSTVFELPLEEYVSNYSTGMKKKLALISVLSMERALLVLDEPFNGLDLESNLLLGRILRMVADSGKTIIVTSHIIESLQGVCDKVHLLERGRIERSYEGNELGELREQLLTEIETEKIPLVAQLIR